MTEIDGRLTARRVSEFRRRGRNVLRALDGLGRRQDLAAASGGSDVCKAVTPNVLNTLCSVRSSRSPVRATDGQIVQNVYWACFPCQDPLTRRSLRTCKHPSLREDVPLTPRCRSSVAQAVKLRSVELAPEGKPIATVDIARGRNTSRGVNKLEDRRAKRGNLTKNGRAHV